MSTWTDLAALRKRGSRPKLPVYITNNYDLCRAEADKGALVIVVKQGEKFQFGLLHMLDVRFRLPSCEAVKRVSQRIMELEILPASAQTFCICENEWSTWVWDNCAACHAALDAWSTVK